MLTKAIADSLQRTHCIRFFPAVGKDMRIRGAEARFEANSQHVPARMMPLGAFSYSRSFSPRVAEIGRYCSIGANLTVMDNAHPVDWVSSSPVFYNDRRFEIWAGTKPEVPLPSFTEAPPPVTIGDDVWIGDQVTIRGGCQIGTGAVIAHSAVVTRDVPPFAVIGGVPAKVIRYRFDEDIRARMLVIAWWDYSPLDLHRFPINAPQDFVAAFEKHGADFEKHPYNRNTIGNFITESEGADV